MHDVIAVVAATTGEVHEAVVGGIEVLVAGLDEVGPELPGGSAQYPVELHLRILVANQQIEPFGQQVAEFLMTRPQLARKGVVLGLQGLADLR